MSIQARFYYFQKQRNSTADIATYDPPLLYFGGVVLKENTSVLRPRIIVNWAEMTGTPGKAPIDVDYVYIPTLFRSYFINDYISLYGDTWEFDLEVDVLGTYRNQILGTEQFVIRSEVKQNYSIPDPWAIGIGGDYSTISFQTPWTGSSVVMEILGNGSAFYGLTIGQKDAILGELFSNKYLDTILDNWEGQYPQLKAELNPLDYIGSLRRFPIDLSEVPGSYVSPLQVGYGTIDNGGKLLPSNPIYNKTVDITFPHHPQALAYLNREPYSQYGLYFPPFGDFPIDSAAAINGVSALISVGLTTGSAKIVISDNAGAVVGSGEASISMDLSMSTTWSNPINIATIGRGGLNTLFSIFSGDVSGAINNATDTIYSVIGEQMPKIRSAGSQGAILGNIYTGYAYNRSTMVQQPPARFTGRPLYQKVNLTEVQQGFVKCYMPELKEFGTRQESDIAESYMQGGFYLV